MRGHAANFKGAIQSSASDWKLWPWPSLGSQGISADFSVV
jgi:hypothetical protein